MTNVGTVSRHIRCYSLLGGVCYLILSSIASVQAAVNPNGFEVLSSKSTGVKSGQYIEAAVSAVYRHGGTAGNTGVYTKQLVPVATSTLRKGALSALGRGVMHPGFQVALLAAGFIIGQNDEIYTELFDPDDNDYSEYDSYVVDGVYYKSPFGGNDYACYSDTISPVIHCLAARLSNYLGEPISSVDVFTLHDPSPVRYRLEFSKPSGGSTISYIYTESTYNDTKPLYEPGGVLAEPGDYDLVDPHIPPHLYDELWNDGPIPEWQDEITVLGDPATYVQPTGDQAVAPEVASQIGKWGENVGAQLDGEPLPNPETDAAGKTSTDSLYEELGLDDPVPPFPSAEPEWQVETIDSMPPWSAGIGEASCPPPTQIQLWGGMSFEISYTPLCDFAGFIRAVVIGVAGFAALYIVLGARS